MPNRSIVCAPSVTAYGHLPKNVMDLNSTPTEDERVEDILEANRAIHEQVVKLYKRTI